jgi:arsenate reductase
MIQIYHNNRCGKSRDCLAFLEQTGKEFEVIKYLENSPTYDELKTIIQKLNIKPLELVRQKDKIWMDRFRNKKFTDDEIIQIMVDNPILIERPIVINENKAIIARPLEKVHAIL